MFGFLRPKRSLVHRELRDVDWVQRTWFEWSIEHGERLSVLVIEMRLDLDPHGADFEMHRLDAVAAALARAAAVEKAPDRVRIIPRKYDV